MGPLAFLADPLSRWRLVPKGTPRLSYLVGLWLAGSVALALATWVCVTLDLPFRTAVCIYLIIIVLLSLMDSLVSSLVFSVIAAGALDYFFAEPKYSFYVASPADIVALATFFVTSLVITGLVRRMREFAETLREQADLLELTHDTVMVRDTNNAITYWNRGAERLYGWGREDAIGKVPGELLRTVYPVPIEDITGAILRDGYWEGELGNTRSDGTRVTVASRWSAQFDDDGRRIGTLETNNDVTERRRAEEALQRSQAAYIAEAQKLSLTGSFGWDTATGEVFWSDQSYSIFECEPEAKPSVELMLQRVHADDVAAVRQAFERAAKESRRFDIEFRLLLPGDRTKHIHAVAHAMTNGNGNGHGNGHSNGNGKHQFVGAIMDVTAARNADERLHQAQAELAYVGRVTSLGALSSSIAHEVNQPLAAIVTNGEACLRWVKRGPDAIGEVVAAVTNMIADGKRASQIVQRIRALSKKTQLEKVELSLNGLVEEVIPLVQREVMSYRASLQLELAPDLAPVVGDRVQLQQVVLNLVLNGIQAMAAVTDRPRVLTLRSTPSADGVLLAVQDSGVGIKLDDAERIFDAFYTTKTDGMGMGLSICRSIIEVHGGQIWAKPNQDGPGAVFNFRLPAAATPAA